ncbi:MAG: fimbrillin family protein [Prevotella sp.]|nr:fimbrillin family protein [Prevotella sp.]
MKKNHKNIILSMALAVPLCMALPGCSAIDDDYSSCGESRLRASIGSGGSRATALESSWEENDQVALQRTDAAEVFAYRVVDPATGTLTPVSISSVVDLTVAGSLRGWSYGGTYGATLPTRWSAAADQSTLANFQQSDVLLAQATAINTAADAVTTLNFQHMTARVRTTFANTLGGVVLPAQLNNTRVVNIANEGTLSAEGAWTLTNEAATFSVTSHSVGTPASGLLADHDALVIPQSVRGTDAPLLQFSINSLDGMTQTVFSYTPGKRVILSAGNQYVYRVSFSDIELRLDVVEVTDWDSETNGTILNSLFIPLYGTVTDWTSVVDYGTIDGAQSLTAETVIAAWTSESTDGTIGEVSAKMFPTNMGAEAWNREADGYFGGLEAYTSQPTLEQWEQAVDGSINNESISTVTHPTSTSWSTADSSDMTESTAHKGETPSSAWSSESVSETDETRAHQGSTSVGTWSGDTYGGIQNTTP